MINTITSNPRTCPPEAFFCDDCWPPITVIKHKYHAFLNNKEFRFFLIGLNSIFSPLPQSEYTSRAVSTPRVRYLRTCVYFCLLSIRCFKVVQPETRFHFQSANQIAKKVKIFKNFKISKFYKKFKNLKRNKKFNNFFFKSKFSYNFKNF
jgi:hypothetical protein